MTERNGKMPGQPGPEGFRHDPRLHDWLRDLPDAPVAPGLRMRVMASFEALHSASRPGWRGTLAVLWQALGGARIAGPALALALVAGVALGVGLGPMMADSGNSQDMLSLAQYSLDDSEW